MPHVAGSRDAGRRLSASRRRGVCWEHAGADLDRQHDHRPVIRGATLENARWDVRGNLLYVLLTGEETGGASELVEVTEWPGAALPCHVHHGFDEVISVLDGELTFGLAGTVSAAPAGSPVSVPQVPDHAVVLEIRRVRLLVGFLPGNEARFAATSRPVTLSPPEVLWTIAGAATAYDTGITAPLTHRR